MMIKLLLFFQGFSIWFKNLLRELSNNIISIFFILFVYLTLWYFPQTVDLLLILNQADAFLFEVPLYFSLLAVSAFLIWNTPKYFYYHNYKDISLSNLIGFIPNQHYKFQDRSESASYPYLTRIHMRKILPRILAILLLAISALSILHAMESFGLENTYTKFLDPTNSLILIIFILLLLSEPRLYEILKKFLNRSAKTTVIFFGISIGLMILIISLGTLNTQAEKDLGNLFLSNCALALLFSTLSFNSYKYLKGFPKKIFYGAILSFGFLLLFIFLILNFNPDLASGINPLSILVLSLLSLFMICFILILLGKKIRLPLLSIVSVFCIFSARFFSDTSDHYQLHLQETKIERPLMDTYIYSWIKSRENLIIKSNHKFPVIMVSAEGGGSRAGLWSFLVHSYLYEKSNGRYFEENLLSLTGASGGSVGNSMFFAEAQRANASNSKAKFRFNTDADYPTLRYKASVIYKENYLSVALLSLLGRDLFKEVTSLFSFKNRGQLLEEQWSQAYRRYFADVKGESVLDREFLSFYKQAFNDSPAQHHQKRPPLLLINTTHTQTGNYNIISPAKYSHLRPLIGMNDFLENIQLSYPDNSVSLATAMRINASFPFITPVGEVRRISGEKELESDQYADAGYYDNIGGRVSRGIEEVFKRVLNDSFPDLINKIEMKHLVIANEEERKIAKTSTQLSAPLTTLRNIRYGHTQEIMKRLGSDYVIKLKPTEIVPQTTSVFTDNTKANELAIKPVLPLGRYLSTIAIRSMEARLEDVSKELDLILE
ncbi:patatin-like phospholipase family protein [Aquimarina sp. SS2-1]|uniref:patatin-like phospholipase family protein n=1 Tax=Aquimarina besae TaxID=3342247 RepID=UPI00366F5CC5